MLILKVCHLPKLVSIPPDTRMHIQFKFKGVVRMVVYTHSKVQITQLHVVYTSTRCA